MALIAGISIVLCFTIGAVTMLAVFGGEGSTPIITSIFGFATTIVMALLTLGKVARVETKVDSQAEQLTGAIEKAEEVIEKANGVNG